MAIIRDEPQTAAEIGRLTAGAVLSCGIGAKATLTASCMDGDSVMLCVQRDVTVNGRTVEPQDVPVKCGAYRDGFRAIAAAASLLMAGVKFY